MEGESSAFSRSYWSRSGIAGRLPIDSSKFKAVNSRDRNFMPGKIERRQQQIEESVQRYLDAVETADRTHPEEFQAKTKRVQEKIATSAIRCVGSTASRRNLPPSLTANSR